MAATRGDSSGRPILLNDEHFVVVPTLGASHPHHLLVCAHEIRTGLYHMTDVELLRLDEIVMAIERALSRLHPGPFVMFENGTAEGGRSGCSVVQHHLHVVPIEYRFDLQMAAHPSNFVIANDLKMLRKTALSLGDYLLIKQPNRPYAICSRGGLPSQYMRKIVGRLNEVEKWDWRAFGKPSDWLEQEKALRPLAGAISHELSLNASN